MDQELKDYLQAMEARMEASLVAKLEQKLEQKLGPMELRLQEHAETVETRLLTEFWKWARTTDMKSASHRQQRHVPGRTGVGR